MSSHHFRPSLKCQECLWSRVSGISELAQSHGTGSLRMFVTGSDRSFKTGLRPVSAFERRARTAGHGANADGGSSTMRCARATRSAPLSTSAWIASIAVKWGSRRAHPEGNRCFAEHCREWEHSRQVGACSVPLGLSPSAEGSRRRARESWMTSARRAMHTECSRGPFASTPPFRSLGETGSAGNAQRCTGSGHMLVGPGALWGRAHSLYLLREAR